MYNDRYSLFRKKYIALRDLYGLDNKLVMQYCTLIYNTYFEKGALTYWANGNRTPNTDAIFSLAALFAVNPLWLAKKDNTYTSDMPYIYSLLQVKGLEEAMTEKYLDLVKEFVSEEYLEEDFRNEYSKEARANILVFLQILIGERKLYPTSKKAVHKERVQAAQNDIKIILETKKPVRIITEAI